MNEAARRRRPNRDSDGDKEDTASISIRLPVSKIDRINDYWKSKNMANRAQFLEDAIDFYIELGDMINSGYSIFKKLEKSMSRFEFISRACTMVLTAVNCPNCKMPNLGDAKYCSYCGKKIEYYSPRTKYASVIFEEYKKDHPLEEGECYLLKVPTTYLEDMCEGAFAILKTTKNGLVSVIHQITTEELSEISKRQNNTKIGLKK